MPTSQKVSALVVVALAAAGLLYTAIAGNSPLLGLDLQGGVSVVLEPTGTADGQDEVGGGVEVTDEALDLTVELLRGRIDEIGVAEPEISRQGDNIVVGLPGLVEDQEEALDRLRQTAELRFRPVLEVLGPIAVPPSGDEGESAEDGAEVEINDAGDGDQDGEGPDEGASTDEGESTDSDDSSAGDEEESLGVAGRFAPARPALADGEDATTEATDPPADDADDSEAPTDDTEAPTDEAEDTEAPTDDAEDPDPPVDDSELPLELDEDLLAQLGLRPECLGGLTPQDDDKIEDIVILADSDGIAYCLGPAVLDDGSRLTGDMVETASVALNPVEGWSVNPTFRPGEEGIDKFNAIAFQCNIGNDQICGTRQLAVVLDHEVISAPVIQANRFERDQIIISGTFTEEEARRLAESLRFGALPIELVAQETRTVSATIGQDVLRSGVVAGIIGLILVAIYLLAYYRLAGLVAIMGLVLSAALLWTIVAWFGSQFGLALTLAGVVGLIVAIGVSADSNIVYFENVKDSYRSGRRVPTAVERAYESAISTIVKADVVSLIAAVLLYLLTVGAVRGFAFYLGLATVLDLIISWMFMRPALNWLARLGPVQANPRLLGLPKSPADEPSPEAVDATIKGGVS